MRFLSPLFAVVAATISTSARAEWRAYETAHFVFYSQSDQNSVSVLARKLESIDALMRMATGLGDSDPVKVRIYEVDDEKAVQAAMGLSGTGVAGFYTSNILGPYAVVPHRLSFSGDSSMRDLVLHHEYAHHFMLQYFPATYPLWYTEGFAELVGSSKFLPDGRIGYGYPAKHRGGIAYNWYPLQKLFVLPQDEIKRMDVYGQGWALTHFLTFSGKHAKQLRQYLQALNSGTPQAEAAKTFGNLDELNREALSYLREGVIEYRPVSVHLEEPLIHAVRPLGAGEADLIPETIAFSDEDLSAIRKDTDRAREQSLRNANLEKIRQKAARYRNDAYALHLLAEAELAAGNTSAAEGAADRLLASDQRSVAGMVVKSRAMSRSAQKLRGAARSDMAQRARALAVQANRLDNNDPLTLVAFFESFHATGARAPQNAVDGLAAAVATLPRNTQIRQMLVDELEGQHRYAEAIAILEPIANSAHKSPMWEAAQAQMTRLTAAKNAAAKPAQAAAPQ